MCVCLCACSACNPPLLAGLCGVGERVWARVSAAPCHSWLGYWGACVSVGAPLVPRHSWLGCATCVCVLGVGFRLRPATNGWGVGVCVCLSVRSACNPPLLAGVRSVGVRVWAQVSAAPCHSWLGYWDVRVCVRALLVPRRPSLGCATWVCVLGFGSRLRPATPGCGGGVCVCWCACSPCTPPLLAGVCGVGVCVWARVLAALRHSWVGCWGVRVCVRAPPGRVCVFRLGFRLRLATPGWGIGLCVFVCAPRLYPAAPGWGVRRGCVSMGLGLGCTPPLMAGLLGCVSVRVRAPLLTRHSWLGCAAWVCVFGPGFRLPLAISGWGIGICSFVCGRCLYPAAPRSGVRRGCVCLGPGLGCAPPLLAGAVGCVCAGVRAPLVPRHFWLGCAVWVCVFGLGFRLRFATRGSCVWVCVFVCVLPLAVCACLGSGFGCASPLLAGVFGCACLCARPACTSPLLAGVCDVGVSACVRVSAAPRHSWLGRWGVCVLVCVLPLYPATPGWGVRCGCVCLGSGFGCALPLVAGVSGCACLCARPACTRRSWLGCATWVCVLGFGSRLRLATPGWGGWVCVCWCACSPCTPPLLAGVCGLGLCPWARFLAPPRHSWRGCWVVCVLVCALRLYPASPGWGVRCGCVCLGSGFGCATPLLAGVLGCAFLCACAPCTPPPLAGVCSVGKCAWARVSAAPRPSWLGCSG